MNPIHESRITLRSARAPFRKESQRALQEGVESAMLDRPNIIYYHVDNLGFGELGCYGGGMLRGAETPRIDQFAREGFQLLNFAPEAQCTPSRTALLTGRYAIRTGNHTVPFAGAESGIVD